MQASMIGPVKMMIRSLDTRGLRPLIAELCRIAGASARQHLLDFAGQHGVPIGRTA
jgi:hypothetical protein